MIEIINNKIAKSSQEIDAIRKNQKYQEIESDKKLERQYGLIEAFTIVLKIMEKKGE